MFKINKSKIIKIFTLLIFAISTFVISCKESNKSKLIGKWENMFNGDKKNSFSEIDHVDLEFKKRNNYSSLTKTMLEKILYVGIGKYELKKDSIYLYYEAEDGTDSLYKRGKLIFLSHDRMQIESINSIQIYKRTKSIFFRHLR